MWAILVTYVISVILVMWVMLGNIGNVRTYVGR